ncbi:MAG: cytochrome c biogenesis protein CcdA [Elusimicrobia bacterium]|nr:cytochrome c biogenesis protein CcdA [Elusimicrobiota bacterium]
MGKLIVAFVAGLLSFVSPCVLPLVPVYLAYLAGTTYNEMLAGGNRWRIRVHALAFVVGFSLVFIGFGASATFLGHFLFRYRLWVERAGGMILIVFGLWMIGALKIGFLHRDIRIHISQKPAGFVGSVLVGAAFGAGWTPCVGPVLASILLLASGSETLFQGVLLLAAYSLGLAVPLLLCSLALERGLRWIKKVTPFLPVLEKGMGICLIVLGLALTTGWFSRVWTFAAGYFNWNLEGRWLQ